MKSVVLAMILFAGTRSGAGSCTVSGASWEWNRFIRDVCFTRTIHKNVFVSPDHTKRIEVEEDKGTVLIVNGHAVPWRDYEKYVVLPIEFSWSPTSEAFFVNDGEGSGMNSV